MRNIRSLDGNWSFIRQDVPSGHDAQTVAWETIRVPHTWNVADAHSPAGYYRGPAWYRRGLDLDTLHPSRRYFLRFEAASIVAGVYVNGQAVGEHRGAFAAFCFDITPYLHSGENFIAVRVDNAFDPLITPLGGDWTFYGGLYRSVWLIETDALQIDPLVCGSSGVQLRQTQVSESSATLEILTALRNAGQASADARLQVLLLDAQDQPMASAEQALAIAPATQSSIPLQITLDHPRLWDGVRDPYLYRVQVRLFRGQTLVDEVCQPVGFRYFSVCPKQGLLLNGRPYPFRGVNYHQQGTEAQGWVRSAADFDRDFAFVREMGCTGVRMSHYQHSEYEYDLCDRYGLVVWDELAMAHKTTVDERFNDNAAQQLRELILQNGNHPSVLFWSLFNEINLPDAKDAAHWDIIPRLNDLAHQLDPTRPTVGAANLGLDHPSVHMLDLIAFNRYWGWYDDAPTEWGRRLDEIAAALPGKPFGISEYGAGASIHHHAPADQRPVAASRWHPEEWQCTFHESAWVAQAQRPHLWCSLIWALFDFASNYRCEGDRDGVNDKGLVTEDRQTRKDAFYYYRANWSTEPFVHITSRRFRSRPAGPQSLKAYSNCASVELFINGRSLGARTPEHGVCVWTEVVLLPGQYELRAVAQECSRPFVDSITFDVVEAPVAASELA